MANIEHIVNAEVGSTVRSKLNATIDEANKVKNAAANTTEKTTPHNDDAVLVSDSQASGVLKWFKWSVIKSTLKDYFDTIYEAAIGAKGTAFNKNFGTTSGTVTQGNDSRLSDSREWTADTVSQVDAEAGTSTDRKAWTPERVKQAVEALGGGAEYSISYGTELTAAANLTRAAHVFKTTLFNRATAADLTLQVADWVVGDWFVIRQIGDGAATIVAEDANVKIPTTVTTAGVGETMYLECYKIDGSDKYFVIINGVE